jgi:hypothetical protein
VTSRGRAEVHRGEAVDENHHRATYVAEGEGTLARSLLASAIDEADPDPANVVALLDHIPGAFERAQEGLRQAAEGLTVPLADL